MMIPKSETLSHFFSSFQLFPKLKTLHSNYFFLLNHEAMKMTWTVRHTRKMFTEDCVRCLYEVYDEYFTAKVYVGGKFKLFPTLIYEGEAVWISRDCKLSPTYWVVKSVVRAHSGCPDERIALCNSRFLSKAMEGKFRVIPDMDLATVQVFVDQIFNEDYVMISDKQKGLEQSFKDSLNVAHRNCVQHIYCNFKKVNRGQYLRDRLWQIARSTNKEKFKKAMKKLKDVDEAAHKWLIAHADNALPLQPPPHVKLAGRPKKKRNGHITEVKKRGRKETLTKWVNFNCGWCREQGHNVKSCPNKKAGNDPNPGCRTKYNFYDG
ncbi:hypothetical protein Leryth_003189 [Lithospermum erythrorhizon]|nr:hypothetical protein Leryth_003189 [Lithospermum erythrorhizon]